MPDTQDSLMDDQLVQAGLNPGFDTLGKGPDPKEKDESSQDEGYKRPSWIKKADEKSDTFEVDHPDPFLQYL